MENGVYLLLGSNLGKREENLNLAITMIHEQAGTISHRSAVYQSRPWGPVAQPDFLNQAIRLRTTLSPKQLLHEIQTIEARLGRVRDVPWGPRTLDIDILFFGTSVIHTRELTVPHPEIANRRFCLVPLCDIAAGIIHPVLKKSCAALLAECTDFLSVDLYVKGS